MPKQKDKSKEVKERSRLKTATLSKTKATDTQGAEAPQKSSKVAHSRRQIKEVKTKLGNLTPAAAAEVVEGIVAAQTRKQVSGFGEFLREQSVVGVGIGIVFGTQVKVVVDAIMAGLINPITKLVLPGSEGLAGQTIVLRQAAKPAERVELGWGSIVYTILTFVIVAAIIFATYKLLRLDRFKKKG